MSISAKIVRSVVSDVCSHRLVEVCNRRRRSRRRRRDVHRSSRVVVVVVLIGVVIASIDRRPPIVSARARDGWEGISIFNIRSIKHKII